MIPYQPATTPMRGTEQEALVGILEAEAIWNTRSDRLRIANRIIDAGFARRVPNKVTKLQLFTYFWEAVLLAISAWSVFGIPGLAGFAFGTLVTLSIVRALTFMGGLIINAAIDKAVLR